MSPEPRKSRGSAACVALRHLTELRVDFRLFDPTGFRLFNFVTLRSPTRTGLVNDVGAVAIFGVGVEIAAIATEVAILDLAPMEILAQLRETS